MKTKNLKGLLTSTLLTIAAFTFLPSVMHAQKSHMENVAREIKASRSLAIIEVK